MNKLTKYLIAVIVGMGLTIVGLGVYNSNLFKKNKDWKHNYEVMLDSVKVVETKYGEVLYEKSSLILEKKDLEEALDISKQQIKGYEKTLGSKLAYISKLESQLNIKDTIKITEIVHDTLSNSYLMHYSDNWLKFDEEFSLKNPSAPDMSIYNICIDVPLKVGLGDNYTIFVQSDNPYFNVTNIEGAVIDGSRFAQKISRWYIGAYTGLGIGYGLINKTIDIGPQVGVGVGFRFF